MKKICSKFSKILLLIMTFLMLPFAPIQAIANDKSDDKMKIEAKSALLIEPTTGKIIYEKTVLFFFRYLFFMWM